MNNLDQIKTRYPDWQKNALGKIDMDNIRWLITEVERLKVSADHWEDSCLAAWDDLEKEEAKVAALLKHQELTEKVIEAATALDEYDDYLIHAPAEIKLNKALAAALATLKEQT